jgi:hypothetical protein
MARNKVIMPEGATDGDLRSIAEQMLPIDKDRALSCYACAGSGMERVPGKNPTFALCRVCQDRNKVTGIEARPEDLGADIQRVQRMLKVDMDAAAGCSSCSGLGVWETASKRGEKVYNRCASCQWCERCKGTGVVNLDRVESSLAWRERRKVPCPNCQGGATPGAAEILERAEAMNLFESSFEGQARKQRQFEEDRDRAMNTALDTLDYLAPIDGFKVVLRFILGACGADGEPDGVVSYSSAAEVFRDLEEDFPQMQQIMDWLSDTCRRRGMYTEGARRTFAREGKSNRGKAKPTETEQNPATVKRRVVELEE